MTDWNGKDRRHAGDRRKQERRRSIRYTATTLVVIDNITWIDTDGTDRRHKIRRREDRERIARVIIAGLPH